jgi:hypothetical protein
MAKQEYEFALILSGVPELTREVLDAFYEAGCDDALIGMRDGVAYAEFCREADSFREAILSAINDVESAGVGALVEHVEPDEFVSMSEIARRLHITREGVRKWVAGQRGPGNFPPPVGSLTNYSPLWRWTDVIQWRQTTLQEPADATDVIPESEDENCVITQGPQVAVLNAVLDLRKRTTVDEALELLQRLAVEAPATGARPTEEAAMEPEVLLGEVAAFLNEISGGQCIGNRHARRIRLPHRRFLGVNVLSRPEGHVRVHVRQVSQDEAAGISRMGAPSTPGLLPNACGKCRDLPANYPAWYEGDRGWQYFGFQWHREEGLTSQELPLIKDCVRWLLHHFPIEDAT